MINIRQTSAAPSKLSILITAVLLVAVSSLFPVPMNNIYHPQLFHTVRGTNKFYAPVEKTQVSLAISPFYYHATKAHSAKASINSTNTKVPIGNIYGIWNMFGLFYGRDGVPVGKQFADFKNLEKARVAIHNLKDGNTTPPITPNDYTQIDYTDETQYDAQRDDTIGSYAETRCDGEQAGIRGDLSLLFACGLGMNLRCGIRYSRYKPDFLLDQTILDLSIPGASPETTPDPALAWIYDKLLCDNIRNAIASDLELDLREICVTQAEDLHLNLFWQQGFPCRNSTGEVDCVIAPYLAVGLWLPSGAKKDQSKYFSVATGNDGFTSFTFEGQLNLHFPQLFQFGLGMSFAVPITSDSRTIFVPTHASQSGIYPWKAHVRVEPGYTWSANLSLKSQIYDNLVFYFDYVFTEHDEDKLCLIEANTTRQKAFADGIMRLEENSCWRAQIARFGGEYDLCPAVTIGAAVTGHISGIRVIRPTEVMGTIRMTF